MLISKFDLYKREWLELVFDNRNKEYGAYELRQHYAGNMLKAMGIAFLSISLLFGAGVILKPNVPLVKITPVDLTPKAIVMPPPEKPIKKVEPPAPKPLKAEPPAPPVATARLVPLVVKPDNTIVEQAPKITDITGDVGQTTTKGAPSTSNALPEPDRGTGTQPDVSVHLPIGLEVMPEPVGGDKAWAKFLNKNLRFPPTAQDEGASGRVILSFIIEKNGSLSNIVVDRAAGHGFDEEALRVLKLAKAWKPGIQNGQPVRVKFAIPINFQAATDER
jgi:periplasmic protein TonB